MITLKTFLKLILVFDTILEQEFQNFFKLQRNKKLNFLVIMDGMVRK